jgi:hypothetical protein
MPPGFSIPGNPLFKHPLARHIAAGIKPELEQRPDGQPFWIVPAR